ncbi:hypothetical protein [Listeria marthii]|uniref:hypothetical protein n=1 Tax=Listeria marthii TaxID=529731 RepID=UPI001887523C|nr:hypothetical protein [Listeria marthii]MBF2503999.1 hypothetical protein [Listeria marthii]
MSTEEFVKNVHKEKDNLLRAYFENQNSEVSNQINTMELTAKQKEKLNKALDIALSDLCFTLLSALDGATSLGSLEQSDYTLYDEDGNKLVQNGQMEIAAYEYFFNRD